MEPNTSFLGQGWSFPPQFSKNGKNIVMVCDAKDISQSLIILLSTNPGDRIMQPNYGCPIRSLVFESFTLSVQTIAREMIRKAILLFEPRISVDSITYDIGSGRQEQIKILIEYTVRSTNTRFNLVFPYYLREGTGVDHP